MRPLLCMRRNKEFLHLTCRAEPWELASWDPCSQLLNKGQAQGWTGCRPPPLWSSQLGLHLPSGRRMGLFTHLVT